MSNKVFEFEDDNEYSIYLQADEASTPRLVLSFYVDWYNNDFAPYEDRPKININDFKFIRSFYLIDFSNETSKYIRSAKNG